MFSRNSGWAAAANLYIEHKLLGCRLAGKRKRRISILSFFIFALHCLRRPANNPSNEDKLVSSCECGGPPTLPERWQEYCAMKRYEQMGEEKIKKKLKGIYAEILVELSHNQPESISEVAEALGYEREWVRKAMDWLEQQKLVRSFKVGMEKDETLNNAALTKLKRKLLGLRGAVYNSVKATRFYVLTLRGEGFLEHALKALGLGGSDEQSD